jgi:hypothetical protein
LISQKLMNERLMEGADPAGILADHKVDIDELTATAAPDQSTLRRIEDLDSIFVKRVPTEYLIKPELPAKAIICLTATPMNGKTTLARAWARDVYRLWHAVLILDRDKKSTRGGGAVAGAGKETPNWMV